VDPKAQDALYLLDAHFKSFYDAEKFATMTGHPVPMDTRGWSQILASVLSGIRGLERQKGADLSDGSDVKAANTWEAIDTPRFNGVIKAGRKSSDENSISSLDEMPHLYLILWDETVRNTHRCRVWVVRCTKDKAFRKMCTDWYLKRANGEIISANFQLHPPRGKDTNTIRNTCGNLEYPLLFEAERDKTSKTAGYELKLFDPSVLKSGVCTPTNSN
jgi:hypothetical protein